MSKPCKMASIKLIILRAINKNEQKQVLKLKDEVGMAGSKSTQAR